MQKTNVSHLNVQSSLMEQAKQTGGWTYVTYIVSRLHCNRRVIADRYVSVKYPRVKTAFFQRSAGRRP